MKKELLGGLLVAAALALPAAPASANIHDPLVPAGVCSNPDSGAVGDRAADVLNGTPAGPVPNPGRSEVGLAHNNASPNCRFAPVP
jgi:hypothetical protein